MPVGIAFLGGIFCPALHANKACNSSFFPLFLHDSRWVKPSILNMYSPCFFKNSIQLSHKKRRLIQRWKNYSIKVIGNLTHDFFNLLAIKNLKPSTPIINKLSEDNVGSRVDSNVSSAEINEDVASCSVANPTPLELKDNKENTSFLLCATRNKEFVMLKWLIEHGADIDEMDNDGNTALHIATEKGFIDIANYLIDKGAQLELKNNSNYTPLLHAVRCAKFEVVKLFLKKGADIHAKNNQGQTALHMATGKGLIEIANYLRAYNT